jgi:hypothetical protein
MFWDIFAGFVNAAASFQEGNATARAALYNKNIANYNANVTRQAGVLEEDRVRREARASTGRMRANIGAGRIDGGSAEDVLAMNVYYGELDALTTRFNYKSKETGFSMQASLYGATAKDASRSKYMSAATALLKGGTNAYKNNTDYGAGDTPFRLEGGGGNVQAQPGGVI